jgi:hypothetical protein
MVPEKRRRHWIISLSALRRKDSGRMSEARIRMARQIATAAIQILA